MLSDKPAEQSTLFKEVVFKRLTVRETEQISRKVAHDKARKKDAAVDQGLIEMEEKFSESLGTRVHIEKKKTGGKILIDFFSDEDLQTILDMLKNDGPKDKAALMNRFIENGGPEQVKIQEQVEAEKGPSVAEAIEETTGIVFEHSEVTENENEVKPGYYTHEDPGSAPLQNHSHDSVDTMYGSAESDRIGVPSYISDEPSEEPEHHQQSKSDDEDVFSMDKFTI